LLGSSIGKARRIRVKRNWRYPTIRISETVEGQTFIPKVLISVKYPKYDNSNNNKNNKHKLYG